MAKLLIIEDDEGLREQMRWALGDTYEILEAGDLETAVARFEASAPALVCLDMGLENKPERGLDIIDELISRSRQVKIIVVTSNTSGTLGSRAVERGAFDYLIKPVDIDELKILLNRASRLLELESPPEPAPSTGMPSDFDNLMIGGCSAMRTIFDHIRRLAKTNVSVLITGESGTGKELCARAIHHHSSRRDKTFMPINCGAIPESLMESELFGYIKGAFTGANTDKTGLIESSHGGTLFLDEIGDMPKNLQVKLLRFLEDQQVQRIGETRFRKLDVRIIAATNRHNLSDEENTTLRTDLYYRLSEFEIHLPPLRERESDILILSDKIIIANREKFSMPKLRLSPRAQDLIKNYSWPGNIRELENKLNRASITCRSQTVEAEDLQLSETSFTALSFKDARRMFEKNFVLNALRHAAGNVSLAAKNSGITRPTFYDLMKKHGVTLKMEGHISVD